MYNYQVYYYFQKLMLTHSYKQTIRLIDCLVEDYDADIFEWRNTFINNLKVLLYYINLYC